MADNDEVEHYNRFHSAVYGSDGELDRKARHLICLDAAVDASCEPCTKCPRRSPETRGDCF